MSDGDYVPTLTMAITSLLLPYFLKIKLFLAVPLLTGNYGK